jgi:succinate dehydrogenase/fumarate reductase flavoprotein subunit
MTGIKNLDRRTTSFDEIRDVIVVGFGAAGAVSAIEAHDAGADVILIEKAADPGGISVCSGGGSRFATDTEAAFQYVKATNGGKTPDDVLRVFAEGMTELYDYIDGLAKAVGSDAIVKHRHANYPFPGFESLSFVEIGDMPGFDPAVDFPHVHGMRGPKLFKVLYENVRLRNIDVRLATPALRLITDGQGEVRGVWVDGPNGPKAIGARKGVILASGGFESSPEIQQQYWQFGAVKSVAYRGNTGDGIRMAQDLGGDLWHLWHFHGSYGFHHTDPAFPFGIRVKRLPDWTPTVDEPDVPMTWIILNREGERFMNEYSPYFHDTGARPLELMDTSRQAFANQPAFLVVDDVGRQKYPLGHVVYNDRDVPVYAWSNDNLGEVQNGILKRAETTEELAAILGADVEILRKSLDEWNAACRAGSDKLGRPAGTMMEIKRAPFFVGEVWPLVSNTQGGVVHDAKQRVLNSYGEAIPRLYEAGELGSIWGHLYLVGGNIAECFVSGRIAAREVAAISAWDSAGEANRSEAAE